MASTQHYCTKVEINILYTAKVQSRYFVANSFFFFFDLLEDKNIVKNCQKNVNRPIRNLQNLLLMW